MNYCTNQVKAGVKGVGRKSLITEIKHSFIPKKVKKERNIRFTLHYYDDADAIVIVTVIVFILRYSGQSNQFAINMAKDTNSIQNSFPEIFHKIYRKKAAAKKETSQVFSCMLCQIFQSMYFYRIALSLLLFHCLFNHFIIFI